MGKKDKKSKKGKGAEKTAKKTERNLDKKAKKEGEYEDLEKLLNQLQEEDKQRSTVTVTPCSIPSPRINFSFTANPDKQEIYLFGGEFDDGRRTTIYNDLFVYSCQENSWHKISSPNPPPPRCGHQGAYYKPPSAEGELWIFGGEFSSPTQTQFFHYRDLYCYRVNAKRWEMVSDRRGPAQRSGHRMCVWKKSLLIFGGFQDSGRYSKYFNDLWMFDFETREWVELKCALPDSVPSPRSGFVFLSHPDYRHVYIVGGFAKERLRKDVEKAVVFGDVHQLTIAKATAEEGAKRPSSSNAATSQWSVKWSSLKPCGPHLPAFPRSGVVGVQVGSGPRGLLFGGATDKEEDEETLLSEYHDDMFLVELDKARWNRMDTILAEQSPVVVGDGDAVDPGLEDASQRLTHLQVDAAMTKTSGTMEVDGRPSSAPPEGFVWPTPRSSVGLAVVSKTLYLFGGMSEPECGDDEVMDGDHMMDISEDEDEDDAAVVMNDFYSAEVGPLMGLSANKSVSNNAAVLNIKWKCLHAGNVSNKPVEEKAGPSSKKSSAGRVPVVTSAEVETIEPIETSEPSHGDAVPHVSQPASSSKATVVNVPAIQSGETFADYWIRTQSVWEEIIEKEMQEDESDEEDEEDDDDDDEIPKEILQKYAKETALEHFRKCKK